MRCLLKDADSAICACLNSSFSVGVLNSVVSQLDGFCDDLCGLFHHGVDVDSVVGSTPLDIRSGLD